MIVENIYEKLGFDKDSKSLKALYRKRVKECYGDEEKLAEILSAYEKIKDKDYFLKELFSTSLMLKKVNLDEPKKVDIAKYLKMQFENPFKAGE